MTKGSKTGRATRATLIALLGLALALPALAQWDWPKKAENLKVLPKETSADELRSTMFSFTRGLGVRCDHCHVGEGNLSNFDFKSDEKPAKNTARIMMQMVKSINGDFISKVGDPDPVKVGCVTCHHGITRPDTLDDVLANTWHADGTDAVVRKYRQLRATYYGSAAYDFSEHVLIDLARTILKENKGDDAISVLKLNTQMYPQSSQSFFYLGEINRALKRNDEAIKNYEKVLEIDPDNENAKKHLAELKGS